MNGQPRCEIAGSPSAMKRARPRISASRWSVAGAGAGHDRRLDFALDDHDFASEMEEIRENGYSISRHRYE
ncbi:hypothetical protein [Kitasatospora sp. NBC_01300]|uniref:hypothetical protein n=1 Tax=Kitasatospora sp. NBC_01300 TaxID=2903574 RepID=UPI002F918CC8|nr:hypothetical protein OG556_37300 [Kitasatospora sp. NBC_01300]